ncbi:MAG: two-component sensor histidine kinase [Bacteroidales bacterium]|nr:two-component sensor histidine kinase [Bacteroidales bacterium]MCF8404127.1 two-component sensor histidine kinase [Bacteroidales bacterium]
MTKYSYAKKLLLYYLSVFVLFMLITGSFQYVREKEYQVGKLETSLNDIAKITKKYIDNNGIQSTDNYYLLDSLKSILPREDVRITVVSVEGIVLYDSFVENYYELENHGTRLEIVKASSSGEGASIRKSASTGKEYYYYVLKFDDLFIRSAVIYNVTIINFLKANRVFFYFIFGAFLLALILLWFVTQQLSQSISKLEGFAVKAVKENIIDTDIQFSNDEIGVIGKQIMHISKNLQSTQQELLIQKDRLLRHLFVINEGVALYTSDKKLIFSNHHFINYLNLISNKTRADANEIFEIASLKKLTKFIDKTLKSLKVPSDDQTLERSIKVKLDNKIFFVKAILFIDRSFEIIITDISKKEKNKIIKSEMTSNIAHELKTPVSAIKAYLETILNNPDAGEKRTHFLQKAYSQAERLSLLINDITTVNKMESPEGFFDTDSVNLSEIVREIIDQSLHRIEEKKINLSCDIPDRMMIEGNRELLHSIFQNLLENSLNYGGEEIDIVISKYHEDLHYYYFSHSDTGVGIEAEHLDRIFERFYRVDDGRSRSQGGTGLGLSIVKNAVQFHKGEISAKSADEGGVKFFFTLRK